MDGDGSVQVNIWRKKGLQYRLVIKLRNDCEKRNISLLEIPFSFETKNANLVSFQKMVDKKKSFFCLHFLFQKAFFFVNHFFEKIQGLCRVPLFKIYAMSKTRILLV